MNPVYLDEQDEYFDEDFPGLEASEEDNSFRGTGLIVGEDGSLALIVCDGDVEHSEIYRINDVEADGLANMIKAVLA